MKITVRDLIQFLLLHTDLDDIFYGFLLTTINGNETNTFDEEDIHEWIRGLNND